jgi:hypothetical protein
MTGIAAFNPAALWLDLQGAASQPLATGVSFDEALRAAEQATQRSFGFNELGLFGRGAATIPPHPPAAPEPDRCPDADAARPELAETGGTTDIPQPRTGQQAKPPGRDADQSAAAGRPAVPHANSEARGAPACPLPAESGPAAPEAEPAAARGAVPARRPAVSALRSPARLAVMIESGRVSLVGRDFTLSDEDRAHLEDRIGAILETYGLGLRELVLNGIPAAVVPFTREDG